MLLAKISHFLMDIYSSEQSLNYFCYLHLMGLGNVEFRYQTIKDRWM